MRQNLVKFGVPSLLGIIGAIAVSCTDRDPCHRNPAEYVEKFGAPEHQISGKDGLCYVVDPAVSNWGSACDSIDLCGGGLICAAPDLPICTNINCNPDPKLDTVCPKEGFACVKTGKATPASICVPVKAPTTPAPAAKPSAAASTMTTADGSMTATPPAAVPNIGTACGPMGDPACVNGAMCPGNPMLPYCTVMSCAAGAENEAACTAAGGNCYTDVGAPPGGICMVDPAASTPVPPPVASATPPAAVPNIGTACGPMGDPACVNGAMCPGNPMLPYCTVMSCAAGAENEAACTAAGGNCYTDVGAPPGGICMVQ